MLGIYLSLINTQEERSRFELLYYKYRYLMRYVANGILHDEGLAEDAVHDAFLKIIPLMSHIDDIQSSRAKNFVVVIVRNISLNLLKKRNHEVHSHELMETDLEGSRNIWISSSGSYNSAQDLFFQKYAVERISKALETLSPALKDTLYLFCIMDFTAQEIASMQDITIDTVYKRLQRARNEMKIKLEAENGTK